MTATFIQIPFPVFFDSNGDPLDDGYVYIGTVDEDPINNPIQVYFDAGLTEPAAQPLRTVRGRIDSGGAPANIYGNLTLPSQYSMTVLNKRRELVFSVPQGTGFDSVLGNLAVTDGNTLTSSNIDGNIIINPNGDGDFVVQADTGIGVASPTAPLQVNAPASSTGSVQNHIVLGRGTGETAYLATQRDTTLNDVEALIVGVGVTGTSEKLRLQEDGKLGLNVTPAELLHVQDTASPAYIQITGPDAGFAALAMGDTGAPKAGVIRYDTIDEMMEFVTGSPPTTRLQIKNNGNIGINTVDPSSLFQVQDNDATTYSSGSTTGQQDAGSTIKIVNTHAGADAFGQLLFRLDNNTTIGRIVCGTQSTAGNSYLSFVTDQGGTPGQRLRIDKDGLFTLNGNTIGFDTFLDEDDMASNDPQAIASQQSIKAYVDAQVGGTALPAGVIWDWAGTSSTVPAGWLLCDGAILYRTTYGNLFAAIGTTYNTGGETETQFRAPNFTGRVSSGINSSGTPGQTFGSDSITLTTAQLPAHSHNISSLTIYGVQQGGSGSVGLSGLSFALDTIPNKQVTNRASTGGNFNSPAHTGTISNTGSGSAIDIRQSSMTMFKIIKI